MQTKNIEKIKMHILKYCNNNNVDHLFITGDLTDNASEVNLNILKIKYSFISLILISISSFAQNSSNLIVFSEDGLKFYLILYSETIKSEQNENPERNY